MNRLIDRFKGSRLCSSHDESTFLSDDVATKRWFFGNEALFYCKERRRSVMISDFLVQRPSNPFFTLNEKEYENAIQRYPQVQAACDINYYDRSATASTKVGQDSYFDNGKNIIAI